MPLHARYEIDMESAGTALEQPGCFSASDESERVVFAQNTRNTAGGAARDTRTASGHFAPRMSSIAACFRSRLRSRLCATTRHPEHGGTRWRTRRPERRSTDRLYRLEV